MKFTDYAQFKPNYDLDQIKETAQSVIDKFDSLIIYDSGDYSYFRACQVILEEANKCSSKAELADRMNTAYASVPDIHVMQRLINFRTYYFPEMRNAV